MKRLQYWTDTDPDYSEQNAQAIEQLDADTYGPTEAEIAEYAADMEARRAKYASMTNEEYNAMLDEWSDEAAARYDAKGGW